MKKKWMTLIALSFGGSLFHFGCLGGGGSFGDFWSGFWNEGWPGGNRWLNLTIDILNEELFG